jgi:hypothetical protein
MVITRNADCNNQTYQLCAKKPKKFMREKFAEKTHEGDYKNADCNTNIPIMYKKNPMYYS